MVNLKWRRHHVKIQLEHLWYGKSLQLENLEHPNFGPRREFGYDDLT